MIQLTLRAFYERLYEYEKTLDIEAIEALAQCVLRNLTREELRSMVREKVFEKTLDIGCGIGYNLMVLLENAKVNHVIGVDIASGAVRIAKKRTARRGFKGKSDFVICDAHFLPFRELVFDLVVCTEVLEHLSDDRKGISEISMVTKANGKVFLSVPSARNSLIKYLTKTPSRTSYEPIEVVNKGYFGLQTGGDFRDYRIEDLAELLNAEKLRVGRQWFNGRFFYSLSVRLNSLILRLGQKILDVGDVHGDFLRDGVGSCKNIQQIGRLLRLYKSIIIPLSNAILSLDLIFLRFDYGGNLTIEAQRGSESGGKEYNSHTLYGYTPNRKHNVIRSTPISV